MEVMPPVAGAVVSQTAIPIIKQLNFVFRGSENVKALHLAAEKLLAKKEDVVKQIQFDVPRGREVTKVVQQWMDRVEAVKKESDEIEERYNHKGAYKNRLEVQVLYDEAKFETVTVERLPPAVQILATTSTIPSTGNSNLELVHECINDDSVGIIGIWGMGGVGKTHLQQQINNSFRGNSSFDHVIFITAKKECTVKKVQSGIGQRLNLGLIDRDEIGERANKIFNFLSERSFILLLDDLWNRVDLKDIGIPFPLGRQRKVVLTTRSISVCGQMETNKKIKVDCLNWNDAYSLFEEKVGVETIQSDPNIPARAEELVRELDGLPLALITIGRAMREKYDSRDWVLAIQRLKESRLDLIEECATEESLFKRLKFSYDSLRTDNLRQCFLACSLWPEDYLIRKNDLIQLWLGLGIVEELGNGDIYTPSYALIRNLLDTCLLEAHQDETYVKMHDVHRDMALWIACDCGQNMNKWIVKEIGEGDSVLEHNGIWCQAEYMALWGCADVVIPSSVSKTNLNTLILTAPDYHRSKLDLSNIQYHAFLTSLDLSFNGLLIFPETICQLVNLRYLNLSHNRIYALPINLKFLINLRYLILRSNDIEEVPSNVISELKELIILDLYGSAHIDLPSVLKDVESLQKIKALSIDVSDKSELQNLSDLVHVLIRSLGISYREDDNIDSLLITSSFLRENNRQKGLVELTFSNCTWKKQLVFENNHGSTKWQFQNLTTLKLGYMPNLEFVVCKEVAPKSLFPILRDLEITGCVSMKNFSWIMYLPCLRWLFITCAHPAVQELFTIEQGSSSKSVEIEEAKNEAQKIQTFPSLRFMGLYYLPEVKSICAPHITFPSLKHLRFRKCTSLTSLPFNTVPSKLEVIEGERDWWDSLQWEDDLLKSSLHRLFKPI